MDTNNIFPLEPTAVISLFALAWFLVGILVGRNLPKRRPGQQHQKRGRNSERDRDRERGKGNGDVELYVGNLSYDVDDKDLQKAFESYGKVVSGRIIQNRFNGKSKGYGFVEMADRNQAMAAIRALNGKELKGRRIVVNEAKSSPRDR
jgi:RNA recognition motif-containing protein